MLYMVWWGAIDDIGTLCMLCTYSTVHQNTVGPPIVWIQNACFTIRTKFPKFLNIESFLR